ncbi:TOMM precursor leader peptide-binding protein [Nonomuraea sp. KM88]|uniref:TOMM precursor leader peptide-binding protein n=1 Tax=Nonomuraea sp. KM88 TaxID=3457427 RepID=UPI003FCE2D6A
MPDEVLLTGDGLLSTSIATALKEQGIATSPATPGAAGEPYLLVAADDGWNTARTAAARATGARLGLPWLRVRAELGRIVIGPLESAGRPGCVSCAEARRRRANPHRRVQREVLRRNRARLSTRPSPSLTALGAEAAATLVAEDAMRIGTGGRPATEGALLLLDLETLAVSRHPVLPDPLCRVCGGADEPDPVSLSARSAHGLHTFRARPMDERLEALEKLYVDPVTGLVRSLDTFAGEGLVLTEAPVGLRGGETENGYGRAGTVRHSRLVALLEALERYGGASPSHPRTVHAAYADVSDRALDPRALGLYPPERYALDGFGFRPFTEDEPITWVWGHSLARERPILVPRSHAYFAAAHTGGRHEHGLVYEVSNGCALGSCLEEAVLFGLMEVAERDAFLLTWYARLPAPRLVTRGDDAESDLIRASIEAETGFEVHLFDITVEQRIPCVWAMAVNPDPAGPALACAAGSHPDPVRAVRNALTELGPGTRSLLARYPGQEARARTMAADPRQVREMEDHALVYGDPGTAGRLSFLTDSPGRRTLAEMPQITEYGGTDLRDDAMNAARRYLDRGMDVIVVDQTAAEHRAAGLVSVKVIVPGTLPMTFGHDHRRVDGLPRLYEVPRLLGHLDRPLRADEVNPHPHPFP